MVREWEVVVLETLPDWLQGCSCYRGSWQMMDYIIWIYHYTHNKKKSKYHKYPYVAVWTEHQNYKGNMDVSLPFSHYLLQNRFDFIRGREHVSEWGALLSTTEQLLPFYSLLQGLTTPFFTYFPEELRGYLWLQMTRKWDIEHHKQISVRCKLMGPNDPYI